MRGGSTSTLRPQRSSWSSWGDLLSRFPQPRLSASVISANAKLAIRIGTPSSRPSSHVFVPELQGKARGVVLVLQEPVMEAIKGALCEASRFSIRPAERSKMLKTCQFGWQPDNA